MLFRHPLRKARPLRASGVLGTSGPPAPSHAGWACNAGAGRVGSPQLSSTPARPSHPGPRDIQKPCSPEDRAPDPQLPDRPSPCTGHRLGDEAAHFEVLLPSPGERRPRRLREPGELGFETPSSQECSVMGGCPLRCHCIGTADTPRHHPDLHPPRLWSSLHPCLQEQSRPPQTTPLQLSCLLGLSLLPPCPLQQSPQAQRPLGQRCPLEAGLPPQDPSPEPRPLAQSLPHPPRPLEKVAPSTCPFSQECRVPGMGPAPGQQRDTLILSLPSLGAKASRAGSTGGLRAVCTGRWPSPALTSQMAGCLC